jgi:hypothetical protein
MVEVRLRDVPESCYPADWVVSFAADFSDNPHKRIVDRLTRLEKITLTIGEAKPFLAWLTGFPGWTPETSCFEWRLLEEGDGADHAS